VNNMVKIAINGFGRIGRPTLRRILDKHPDLEIAVINDLTDSQTLAHLLKYDSLYGIYKKQVKPADDSLLIDDYKIKVLKEKEPAKLPWKEMEIDVVLECTGFFTKYEQAKAHLSAGAKKVIISAPSKSKEVPTFVLGVNEEKYNPEKDNILSMGSCTTNCLAPMIKVIHENFKIEKALMTTIHSYTNDQRLLDLPHEDLRRARAAALNLVPTTTGAAISVVETMPELKGKLDGIAIRIPTPVVSLTDLTALVKEKVTIEEVNYAFKKAASDERLKGILGIEDALLVSSDYKESSFSAIVDAASTMVIENNLIKILAWYDNEWGYACRLAEFAEFIGGKI